MANTHVFSSMYSGVAPQYHIRVPASHFGLLWGLRGRIRHSRAAETEAGHWTGSPRDTVTSAFPVFLRMIIPTSLSLSLSLSSLSVLSSFKSSFLSPLLLSSPSPIALLSSLYSYNNILPRHGHPTGARPPHRIDC